jgi:hypothetical protein
LTSFFSETFRQHLLANPTFFDTPKDVAMVLFTQAPEYADNDARYAGIETVEDLSGLLGWEPPIHWGDPPVTEIELPLVAPPNGDTRYIRLDNAFVLPDDAPSLYILSVGFIYKGTIGSITDPLIFVTNSPVGAGMVLNPGDAITARPDATADNERWLFSYTVTTGPPAAITTVPGPLATLKAEPPFDASRTQHVWLYPQRVNLIANPSFEAGMTHWRTNGTPQQINGSAPDNEMEQSIRRKAGQFSGASPLIVESNMFPASFGVRPKEMFTIRLNAKGNGRMKVAMLSWMADFSATRVDWGLMPDPENPEEMIDAEWQLSPKGFISVCTLRMTPEARYAMVRIEVEGDLLILDNCLVEEGWVPAGQDDGSGGTVSTGFPYFDGDSLYGARDDFSWYGGEDCQGHTYSCWYNHRRAVVGRLFAFQTSKEDQAQPTLPPVWSYDPNSYMPGHWFSAPPSRVLNRLLNNPNTPVFIDACDSTPTTIANQGVTADATVTEAQRFLPEARSYFWFPASAGNSMSVPDAANLDITATMAVIAEIAPPTWSPLSESVIASKWLNAGITPGTPGYIVPLVGGEGYSVSTPDHADYRITGTRVITARVRFSNDVFNHGLVVHSAAAPNQGWSLSVEDRVLNFRWSTTGASQPTNQVNIGSIASFGYTSDVFIGVKITPSSGGNSHFQMIRSTDGGVTWANVGLTVMGPAFTSTFDTTATLKIGNFVATGADECWTSRVYWVEMRNGTDPKAGTVIFRCDASERAPTENPWTDPTQAGRTVRTWTAVAAGVTAGMLTAGGNGIPIGNSWVFSLLPTGALQLLWGKPTPPPWETASFDSVASDMNLSAFAGNSRHLVAFTFLNSVGGGNAEIRFWHSDDGVTWTQLGSTMTKPTFSLIAGTARFELTAQSNAEAFRSMEAKVYSAKVYNTTGATGTVPSTGIPVLDIDCDVLTSDDYGQPTFLATTGQVVTVNRGASGYISTMTPALDKGGRPFFMLDGVNDYIEIPHHASLNIPDDGNFVVVIAGRQKSLPKGSGAVWVQKVNSAAPNDGWQLPDASTPAGTGSFTASLKDAASVTAVTPAHAFNTLKVPTSYGFRKTDKLVAVRDSLFSTPVTVPPTLGTVGSPIPVQIGRLGTTYEALDFFGMCVLTQLLNDTELSNLAIAMRDGSDVYHHGDRWTITDDGIFAGIPLSAGDTLVAVHPTGASSPMSFDEVIWDTQAEGGGVVTNVEIERQGLVYKWIPSGLVVYHLDVLFPYDTRPCPPPVTGDVIDRDEVPDPWVEPPPPDTEPPTAPVLTVDAFTSTQVDLSWTAATDNVGVTQYLIERAVGAGSAAFHQIFTTAILTYSDIGLTRGETYRYRVRATDAAGNLGPFSNVVEVTTEGEPSLWDEALWDEGFWGEE